MLVGVKYGESNKPETFFGFTTTWLMLCNHEESLHMVTCVHR